MPPAPDRTMPPLIKALMRAGAYPHDAASVELVETHISWVLLTGKYAYKIKKPVNFGFLDFSTLAKRMFYCREEVRLNRRLAPDWYLEVAAIAGPPDRPRLQGAGEAIEYAVKMRQFPSVQTLKDLAEQKRLNSVLIDDIADKVAFFHQNIAVADASAPYGDSLDIRQWADGNFSQIRPLLDDPQLLDRLTTLEEWSRGEWTGQASAMQLRKTQGFIRECHGDLHLGNMVLIDGGVVLFDCIEFNPRLYWIDVISDLAFLVMDLMHLGADDGAYRLLNRYLEQTGDYEGLKLLRYYLVYRALVRAKVGLLRTQQLAEPSLLERIYADYRLLAGLAERLAAKPRPMLIITHGFSGSGKSTYAAQLAEKIKAVRLRSDAERKRLAGLAAEAATFSPVDGGIYSPEASRLLYRRLAELALSILSSGFSVIVDAAFLKAYQRDLFVGLASAHRAEFRIVAFRAAESTLRARIGRRRGDPSEATAEVLRRQQQSAEPFSDAERRCLVTVDTERRNALEDLLARL